MLFTELGMERLDVRFVNTLVCRWRDVSIAPDVDDLATSQPVDVAGRRLTVREKPIIAVLSADLRNHPVGRFWLPMARHLHRHFRVIHVDFSPHHDDVIKSQLISHSFEWINWSEQDDVGLLRQLRFAEPSILLDLGGHTADNRPAFLNHRIAPVQATYLGFYGPSYGLECDWWILDSFIARRVQDSYPGAESIWPLPCPSLCYDPEIHNLPPLDAISYIDSVDEQLGSFNHTRKLSSECIARMSSVLARLPGAVLKFRSHSFYDSGVRAFLTQRFLDQQVAPHQLQALPYAVNPHDAMHDFSRLHLHLDSYPVSGTTTTLDSLAMGIPVLTSPNHLYAGAISACLLESIGLEDMVCDDPADLPARAEGLIRRYRSPSMRRSLARQVRSSALCDTSATPACFLQELTVMLKSTPPS